MKTSHLVLIGLTLTTCLAGSARSQQANQTSSQFVATISNSTAAPKPAPDGMVWIPGGEFSMGASVNGHGSCEMPMASNDTEPIHRVRVDGFFMDKRAVTNEQFEKFVNATGYVTIAERTPTKEEFPTAPQENLVAGSVVFAPTDHEVPLNDHFQWWTYVKGANWRKPLGPESDIKGKEKYPVVQIAYPDAEAYAKWAGKRLPTEAEFEFAARGGLTGKTYTWGDEFRPDGKWMANTWQGLFPVTNTAEDGFVGTSPVGSFPANGYGLSDMAGNVWQWCSDWYRADTNLDAASKSVCRDPRGPAESYDPAEPYTPKRVVKGGSFLCNPSYCESYRPSARRGTPPDTGSSHTGFRCVMSANASQVSDQSKAQ